MRARPFLIGAIVSLVLASPVATASDEPWTELESRVGYLDLEPPECPDPAGPVVRIEPEPGEIDLGIYLRSDEFVWGPILIVSSSDGCSAGPST